MSQDLATPVVEQSTPTYNNPISHHLRTMPKQMMFKYPEPLHAEIRHVESDHDGQTSFYNVKRESKALGKKVYDKWAWLFTGNYDNRSGKPIYNWFFQGTFYMNHQKVEKTDFAEAPRRHLENGPRSFALADRR